MSDASDKAFDLEKAQAALRAAQVADEYGDRLEAARWVWEYAPRALAEIVRLREETKALKPARLSPGTLMALMGDPY